jgi:hypothetical protein
VATVGRAGTVAAAPHSTQSANPHEPRDPLGRGPLPALTQRGVESGPSVGLTALRVHGFELNEQPGILARARRGPRRPPAVVTAARDAEGPAQLDDGVTILQGLHEHEALLGGSARMPMAFFNASLWSRRRAFSCSSRCTRASSCAGVDRFP